MVELYKELKFEVFRLLDESRICFTSCTIFGAFARLFHFFLVFHGCFSFFLIRLLGWLAVFLVVKVRRWADSCFIENLLESDLVVKLKWTSLAKGTIAVDACHIWAWVGSRLLQLLVAIEIHWLHVLLRLVRARLRRYLFLTRDYPDKVRQIFKLLAAGVAWTAENCLILLINRHFPPPRSIDQSRCLRLAPLHECFEVSRVGVRSLSCFQEL